MAVRSNLTERDFANGAAAAAQANRAMLRAAGVFAVNVVGGPGCGKSTLIRAALEHLAPDRRVGVVVAGAASHHREPRGVDGAGGVVVNVPADPHLPLTASHVRAALGRMDLRAIDVLLVENVPPAGEPAACDLGLGARVCVFSVAAGDRKPAEHPEAIRRADLVVLNKTDLLPLVPFDLKSFEGVVRGANPGAPLARTSAVEPGGAGAWIEWLRSRAPSRAPSGSGK